MNPFANKAVAGAILVALTGALLAQAPALTRTVVVKGDVSVPGREAVATKVEIAPGGASGWHTHPGDEISVVDEGEVMLSVAGQPPRRIAAGEGFVIPAGVPHNAKNEGATPTRLVGVYAVDKGRPLASPASAPAP